MKKTISLFAFIAFFLTSASSFGQLGHPSTWGTFVLDNGNPYSRVIYTSNGSATTKSGFKASTKSAGPYTLDIADVMVVTLAQTSDLNILTSSSAIVDGVSVSIAPVMCTTTGAVPPGSYYQISTTVSGVHLTGFRMQNLPAGTYYVWATGQKSYKKLASVYCYVGFP